jgi:aspartate racemase
MSSASRATEVPATVSATDIPRTVGILGGMGPEATVDLMRRVIAATPAADDADHIPMLVDNNPQVPSRVAALIAGTGPSPAPVLMDMALRLEAAGARFLAMPCNTAHHYHREVAAAVRIPFLDMVALAAQRAAAAVGHGGKVGLLASSALEKISLYEAPMAALGLQLIYPQPPRQAALMDLIGAVKAGKADAARRGAFSAAAQDVAYAGAELLLIACTELSVIAADLHSDLPAIDASQVLAEAVVATALSPAAGG